MKRIVALTLASTLALGLLLSNHLVPVSSGDEPSPPPPADVPAAELLVSIRQASFFGIGPTGIAGTPSPAETALRQLIEREDAQVRLLEILRNSTQAGKMYALLGLKTVAPPTFTNEVAAYQRMNTTNVHLISGCIVFARPVGEVAQDIARGKIRLTPEEEIQLK